MIMMRIVSVLVLLAAACGTSATNAPAHEQGPATALEATQFIERAESDLRNALAESDRTDWVQSTFITDDTEWLAARRSEEVMALRSLLIEESKRFDKVALPPDVARKMMLLK